MGAMKWTLALTAIVVAYFSYKILGNNVTKSGIVKIGKLGNVQGIESTSRNGREFSEYLGLPYAKPPVHFLRFESPEEAGGWKGIRDADRYSPECPQRSMMTGNPTGDEDCLYLNVFVPKITTKTLLPVMFFIHGGGFFEGSSTYYRPDYFMDHDVILVTINYRLGALGFLNTNDGLIRGNMGLKDQSMALKWVNKYIKFFGGDNEKVTIFGESAGGASVHYHMMSLRSKGLFQRAIAQSGTGFIARAYFGGDTSEQAKRLASHVNCSMHAKPKDRITCLKIVPASTFVELNNIDIKNPLRDVISLYEPTKESVIDGDTFLSDHPHNLFSKLRSTVPWIAGVTSQEGLLVEAVLARSDELKETLSKDWNNKMPYLLHMNPKYSEIMDTIKEFYFKTPDGKSIHLDFDKAAENYTNLLSDRIFLYGFHESIRMHVEKNLSPTYIYYFEYEGDFSIYPLLAALKGNYPPIVEILLHMTKTWINKSLLGIEPPKRGVCHADELQYLFRWPMGGFVEGHPSDKLSKELVRLWVSFARNEERLHFNQVEWKPVEKSSLNNLKYLRIGETASMIDEPFRDRILFWDKIKDYHWGSK